MTENEATPDPPILNIVGAQVALGPLRRDLLPLYDRWFNNFEVGLAYFAQLRPHTREAREAWYERLAKDDPACVDFLIYEHATLRPIGKCGLDQEGSLTRVAFGMVLFPVPVGTRQEELPVQEKHQCAAAHFLLLSSWPSFSD